MTIKLSEHLTAKKIFFATIAPICMMVFFSLYTVVDGLFISGKVGVNAFSGVNLVWPYLMILASIGMMFGAGGSALVSKYLGEQKEELANKTFSLIVYFALAVGVVTSIVGYFTMEPFVRWMISMGNGATEEIIPYALRYGRILAGCLFFQVMQNTFQAFFTTAERPFVGFLFVFGAGITNVALDALFIYGFNMGVEGAALGTVLGTVISGGLPFIYFFRSKNTPIHLCKTIWSGKDILKSATNGCSEFLTNISGSVVSACYNAQLLRFVADGKGVSAYGILMYMCMVFMAIYSGYTIGVSPFVGYNYGAKNNGELHNIFKKSMIFVAITGVIMFSVSELAGPAMIALFAHGDQALIEVANRGARIFSFVYLTAGFSIFASGFFTALNNGIVSGIISIVRSLVCELAFVFLLPLFWGIDGVWAASVFAEIGSSAISLYFYIKMQRRYHY